MTDYLCIVRGVLGDGRSWSTGRHITSNQTMAGLLATWQTAWTDAWNVAGTGLGAMYSAGTTIAQFECSQLDAQQHKIQKALADVALPGTSANTDMPEDTCVVIDWTSPYTTRYGRGSQKLPPPTQNAVTGDTMDDPFPAQFTTAMQSIQTAIQADGSTFYVTSDVTTVSGRPPYQKTVLTAVKTRDQLGSWRPRTRKVISTYHG